MSSVWYMGRAKTRSISVAEWAAAGVTAAADTIWNAANGYSIPASNLSAAQITVLSGLNDFNTTAPDGPRTGPAVTADDTIATRGFVSTQIANSVAAERDREAGVFKTVPRRYGAAIITVGDSITAGDSGNAEYSGGTGQNRYVNMDSWFGRACAISKGKIRWAGNAAVSGQTTVEQLASFQAKVIDRNPDYVALMVGSNDPNQGYTVQQTRANITQMMDMAQTAGIGLILCSLLPRTTHDPTKIAGINFWLREQATVRGAIWVDFFSLLIDPVTGDPKSGMTRDGTHPTPAGRSLMADAFVNTVSPRIASWNPPICEDSNEAGNVNLIANPLFLGTPDANGVAPSWVKVAGSYGAGSVPSVVDKSGWLGKAQQIVQAANSTSSLVLGQYISAGFKAGDRFVFTGRFDGLTAGAADGHISVYLGAHSGANGGGTLLKSYRPVQNLRGGEDISDAVFFIDDVIPDGTVSLGVYFGAVTATGPSTLRVGQMALRNLTALGV